MTLPKTFRHMIIDSYIVIDNGTGTSSSYPLDWWMTQEPSYQLPPENVAVLKYTIGGGQSKNFYITKDDNVAPLPQDPWLAIDGYITKQAIYDAAYATYLIWPHTLNQAKSIKFNELMAKYIEKIEGSVNFDNGAGIKTYSSTYFYFNNFFHEKDLFTSLGSVPIGYKVRDDDHNEVSFTLVNLQDLVILMQQLRYECRLTYANHHANINALTTIDNVMAYDIATGWVTTPYNP
jgi:hypothetical protein